MKLLFLLRLWPVYGGGETVTLRLANEFSQRGYEVHIVYFKYNDYNRLPYIHPNIKAFCIEGVQCDECSFEEDKSSVVNQELCSYINKNSIDIVLNIWLPLSFIKDIKKQTNAKVLWCRHATFAQKPFLRYSYRFYLKHFLCTKKYIYPHISNAGKMVDEVLPYVDNYIFLSNQYVKQYRSYTSNATNLSKIKAIPNPTTFDETFSNEDIKKKDNLIVIISRLDEHIKRVSTAIRIWGNIESIDDERLNKWKLCIVGEGESKDDYINLVKQLNLKRVSFEGFKNPIPYYKKSKILIMTSPCEGFPMTIVESLQFGVIPVVMDSTVALKDIIKNKKNGVIIPYGDEKKMLKNLLRLMKDEKKMYLYANNCISISKEYSINSICNKWMDLLENI